MEEPPEVNPKDWKTIRMQLLKNVKVIDAPPESSYYGMIGGIIMSTSFIIRGHRILTIRKILDLDLGSYMGTCKVQRLLLD